MYLVSLTMTPVCPLTYDVFFFGVALTYTPAKGGEGDVAPFFCLLNQSLFSFRLQKKLFHFPLLAQ